MFKSIVGQGVGVVSIAAWLSLSVYAMSRAADATATDQGNWFVAFVLLTLLFVAIMAFWRRAFGDEH